MKVTDVLPLPFKVLVLLLFTVALWYLLVFILYTKLKLNVAQLINFSYTQHSYLDPDRDVHEHTSGEWHTVSPVSMTENVQLAEGILRNLRDTSAFVMLSFFTYKILDYYEVGYSIKETVVIICITFTLYKLFYNWSGTQGQVRIYTTLKRILVGGIALQFMRSNDILVSDSFVSFSRVFNDLVRFLCFGIDYNKYEWIALVIPTAIRIKQCWYEYRLTGNISHVFNLAKYCTNLGPLYLAATQVELHGLLVTSLLINSTYSFIWDLKMDWGLSFRKGRIVNRQLHWIYYVIILINFILRYIWVFKIARGNEYFVHFATIGEILYAGNYESFGYMTLQVLELIRRWNWCFLKLMNDASKMVLNDIELQLQ